MSSSSSLPDAPLPQSGPRDEADQTSFAEGSAAVSGIVLDTSGAAYLVIINAKGFAPFTSRLFSLSPQQPYEVPNTCC